MNKSICNCKFCTEAKKMKVTESDMHEFVGLRKSNKKCDLVQFEADLEFHNVIHWDVGYSDNVRYYIYRDVAGKLLAWYDTIKNCGFKAA